MSEYTKKKSDKVMWYSDSFYTHHKWYKMYLYIRAAGYSGDYLSVQLYLMKGPYDDQSRWPLQGHCEVKLLNQISNSEHHLGNGYYRDGGHKRVISGKRSGCYMWYTYQFISHDHLHQIMHSHAYVSTSKMIVSSFKSTIS